MPVGTSWTADDARAALERVVDVVRDLPEVEVQPGEHGHTGVAVRGRRFAWLTVDHHDDGRLALHLASTPEEQAALVADDPERFFVPPYTGSRGWVGILLDPASQPDWNRVAELLEAAWRARAPRRVVAARDAAQHERHDAG